MKQEPITPKAGEGKCSLMVLGRVGFLDPQQININNKDRTIKLRMTTMMKKMTLMKDNKDTWVDSISNSQTLAPLWMTI